MALTAATREDINNSAVFAVLMDGTRLRLTGFMPYDQALAIHEEMAQGRVMQQQTVVWERDRFGTKVGGPRQVKFFAVRNHRDPQFEMAVAWERTDVLRMSERTYTTDEGAIKAWNRATGKRYTGKVGGHIYDVTGLRERRIGQGWYSCLAQRAGLLFVNGGTRYTASKVTVTTRETYVGDNALAVTR